jgi:multiple sugar transport system permease protein
MRTASAVSARSLTWFLLPALALLFIVRLLPFGWAVRTSVSDRDGIFVGLDNFRYVADSVMLPSTIKATLTFVLLTVVALTLVSLVVALIFTQPIPFAGLMRTMVFLPIAVPLAGSAIFWSIAFRPDGLINTFLGDIGVEPLEFLSSKSQALPAMVVMVVWISVGYGMIFLIGGIRDIPEEVYEAASIDGAHWWQKMLFVTMPLVRRQLLFVVVSNTSAAFVTFAPIAILTRGGPSGATNLVMWDVYQRAYIEQDMPAAMAEVCVVMVLMVATATVQFRLLKAGT